MESIHRLLHTPDFSNLTARELSRLEVVKQGLLYRGVGTLTAARILSQGHVTSAFSSWVRNSFPNQIQVDDSFYYWLPNTKNLKTSQNLNIQHLVGALSKLKGIGLTNVLKTTRYYSQEVTLDEYLRSFINFPPAESLLRQDIYRVIFHLFPDAWQSLLQGEQGIENEHAEWESLNEMLADQNTAHNLRNALESDKAEVLTRADSLLQTLGEDLTGYLGRALNLKGVLLVANSSVLANSHFSVIGGLEDGEVITASEKPLPLDVLDAVIPLSEADAELLNNSLRLLSQES